MPKAKTSPKSCSVPSVEGEMRMVRGTPSASAARTVLMTAGCAQPPPIQPWMVPSGVMTALSPGRDEVGGVTRSTVAKA